MIVHIRPAGLEQLFEKCGIPVSSDDKEIPVPSLDEMAKTTEAAAQTLFNNDIYLNKGERDKTGASR